MNLKKYMKTGEKISAGRALCAGFTLAELLAVVIIVSLMTTFGVVYYGKAQQQARFSEVLNEANNMAEDENRRCVEEGLAGIRCVPQIEYGRACDPTELYCVEVNTDYYGVPGLVTCVGKETAGKAFCESVGYGNCEQAGSRYNCRSGNGQESN